MVPEANTVRDPRTMMIHAKDARPAHSTMMSTVRLVAVAPLTLSPRTGVLHLKHLPLGLAPLSRSSGLFRITLPLDGPIGVIGDRPRIGKDSPGEADDQHDCKELLYDGLDRATLDRCNNTVML